MRHFENIGQIMVFIKDSNKKSFLKIIKEVFVLFFIKREIPFYYFKYFFRKEVENYLDYLSTGEVNVIGSSFILHNPAYRSLLENKLFFALLCEKSSLNIPKLISYNLGNIFYHNNTTTQIFNKSELLSFFEHVFTEDKLDGLFFRPPSEYGGKGCFKINRACLKKELDDIFDAIISGYYVHTEIIKQHSEINKIHDKSVSTLRIISLITSENQPKIICAFMRFGVGNSVVDNVTSGGFFVGVNMNNGTLKKEGYNDLNNGGKVVYEHPDSHFKFEGFKVPYFKEACDEVLKGVKVIPDRFIGWDVAITPNGPIIVEANWQPDLPASDIAYGGLLKSSHIKNILEELKQK
ncbi:sugar-transfer associated ATP-grasp domain-containing protein [Ancylomarina sp. 16SWW S1-10-2]|uniref:sugar-transfer associated ATP-grasp domain-containing protein n=1 Tax=Ancylomarina sp. 16SWW S1-10-2 TaxID=2499681 RepID=UPI0012AD3B03|nr:sugar-transfer associated ATP-grasp domain-containing protein [Ancylomarina sp. 16SWW S1-10-2]MRT93437.1 hypothetical protein [Ancylomarina sp. 16SWW S1-10-2]